MKITVVVPTDNRPDALKKVLTGLELQTCIPHEVIVADDGSGSSTTQMVTAFKKESRMNVLHVRQEDKGFRAARIRNKAIARSTGDYIVLLDGDCIPERHFIEDHADLAQAGCFFQGKRVLVNEKAEASFFPQDCNSLPRRVAKALKSELSNRHHIFRISMWPSKTTTKLSGAKSCNMGFFKQDLVAVNGFNHDFEGWGREDSELVVRLFKYGLLRKENRFRAICYHLWHAENDRQRLEENDRMLKSVMDSGSSACKKGLNELM